MIFRDEDLPPRRSELVFADAELSSQQTAETTDKNRETVRSSIGRERAGSK